LTSIQPFFLGRLRSSMNWPGFIPAVQMAMSQSRQVLSVNMMQSSLTSATWVEVSMFTPFLERAFSTSCEV